MAAVQYTFTHRQYTERHNETEYTDTLWQQYNTHLHTDSTQNNTMKQNTQKIIYVKIRIYKHKNKNT